MRHYIGTAILGALVIVVTITSIAIRNDGRTSAQRQLDRLILEVLR